LKLPGTPTGGLHNPQAPSSTQLSRRRRELQQTHSSLAGQRRFDLHSYHGPAEAYLSQAARSDPLPSPSAPSFILNLLRSRTSQYTTAARNLGANTFRQSQYKCNDISCHTTLCPQHMLLYGWDILQLASVLAGSDRVF
jgi:hypothetical protein